MRYAAHEAFIAPARARSELWRSLLGYALINVAHIGLIIAAFTLASPIIGESRARAAFDDIFNRAETAPASLLLLGSFLFLAVAVTLVAGQLHRRGAVSLTGPPRLAAAQFLRALRALAVLYLALFFLLPDDTEYLPNLPFDRWLALLPLSVAAILVQTLSEELLFRGYLQQQLAARFSSPLVWMGLPAVLFAWEHYNPVAGPNALPTAAWAGAFALVGADLTARTGTLGPAVALHFANNAVAVLLVSLPGPVSGLSLYQYPFTLDSALLQPYFTVELALLAVSWLTLRVAFRV